jgi:hypothetical protein
VLGTCDCIPKCLLCKQSGHTSRDKGCSHHGDFAPPRLPKAALVEVAPPVEDAAKVAAIPHLCQAHPAKGRDGKGKGKMTLADSLLYPQDECSNSHDGLPLLLCFCCLMMEFSHYQQLYVGNDFSTEAAPKTSNGKDIIKLHSEFTIQKNNGETFTRKAQKDFPDGFHLDKELAGVISKSALAIDRGSGHFGPRYPGDKRTNDHWLEGMGEDPEMVDLSKLLADTEVGIMGWKTVTSSKGSSSKPLPLVVQSTTEYSWMLGGKRIPLGFVNPPPL